MLLKRYLKKIGRWFILLHSYHISNNPAPVNILIVWITYDNHIKNILKEIKEKFKSPEIFILTSEANRGFVETEMPDCELILPAVNTKIFRYARQLFRFRKDRFDLMILTKLDISITFSASLYYKIPILLNNIWGEWYTLSLRKVSELFILSEDTKRQRLMIRPIATEQKRLFMGRIRDCFHTILAHISLFINVTFILIKVLIRNLVRF